MDRLEFDKKGAGIPLMTGPNYSRLISIRKKADTKADSNLGPFSSLIDYDKEAEALETEKTRKQTANQKIMRTNAIGDAFRLIMEGMGAFGGSTITPRNVNPGILSAYQDYARNDIDYISRLEGLKTRKLAAGQADLQYNLSQNAAALDKAERQADRSHQEAIQASRELNNFIHEQQNLRDTYRLRGLENEAAAADKRAMLAIESKQAVDLAQKREEFARGIGLTGVANPNEIDVLSPPRKGDTKSWKFITPDTKKTITIRPELANYIRTQLQQGKNKYDPNVPQVLRDAMKDEVIKPESLATVFQESWDYIRDNILPPSVVEQIYGAGSGEEEPAASTQPANTVPKQQQLEDGTVTLDNESLKVLQTRINNSLNDVKFDLSKSHQVKNKIKELADLIYSNYKAAGIPMTENEALTEAQDLLRAFRAKKQAV